MVGNSGGCLKLCNMSRSESLQSVTHEGFIHIWFGGGVIGYDESS